MRRLETGANDHSPRSLQNLGFETPSIDIKKPRVFHRLVGSSNVLKNENLRISYRNIKNV
jgi:hypothetical protein